jgi:hypothetical protein
VDDHQCDNITKVKKKPLQVQVDEIFNFLNFLVNVKVKCTYAFSTFNKRVIIYQILNVKNFEHNFTY